jgi:hypothetical protein
MGESLRIELPWTQESDELADALRGRGLEVDVVDEGEERSLEVRYATDERERLFADVSATVEGWANDRGTPLILTRLGDRCALRPPAD